MNKWEHVRRAARDFRKKICEGNRIDHESVTPSELIALAAGFFGIDLVALPPEHPQMGEEMLARLEDGMLYYRNDVAEWLAFYYQAHEFGHIVLDHGMRECTNVDIDPDSSETKMPFGVHRVEGYGPQERIECEANVFAREFLLPRPILSKWWVENGLTASQISERTGLDIELVCHQLAFALLTPEITDEGKPADGDRNAVLTLDPSQTKAAEVEEGPQLVDAGPGTGKTRTLVGRVLHLIATGVLAENILVLTFSNKAAEELRLRIGKFVPGAAESLTIETFHSFGLELLRKFGTKIGLPAEPKVIDPVEAIFLLEKALPELDLDYYQYLSEPSRYLPDIARAISRAKDENVGPDEYLAMAEAERAQAASDAEVEKAERAAEVARVYGIYERHLEERKAVDLADLILKAILLMSNHEDVRTQVRASYQHVLVDEYQDVNRASGLLLKEIVGDGKNLWAVGDLRQSIHRWRGATTANIRLFDQDFPLAREPIPLARNYRSHKEIVDLFSSFAQDMKASQGREFKGWEINQDGEGSSIHFNAASDPEAEALGIAHEILRLREGGIEYKEQAVICRTHAGLARVARVIADAGIPVLYMGDIFERPEIRDLLSLVSLASGPDGSGLVRVARFPEYDIAFDEVVKVIQGMSEKSIPFPGALAKLDEVEEISDESRAKLVLIAEHLDGLTHGRSAWKCLTRYLFDRSSFLTNFMGDKSPIGQHRRLAIYQFLQFVHSRLDAPKLDAKADPKRDLLTYIRRLEIFGDEKNLREPDEWASSIDAVRIMTVHASKGLEFKTVFLPGLVKGGTPLSAKYNPCPPVEGLLSETDPDWQKEEEECLFFVGVSRARERLYLSRPLMKLNKNKTPSDYLHRLSDVLPSVSNKEASWIDKPEEPDAAVTVIAQGPSQVPFRPSSLDRYVKCPLSYFYQNVIGLSRKRGDTAYLEFHRAVHRTVDELKKLREAGESITEELAQETFESEWEAKGPKEHFLGDLYKASARTMVSNAAKHMRASSGAIVSDHLLRIAGGEVEIAFDLAEMPEDGGPILIQRTRTGRPTKSELDRNIYGLLIRAGEELSGGAAPQVEILYLRDKSIVPMDMSEDKVANRVAKYEAAIRDIAEGRFPAKEDEYECPRCPQYFICPAAN